MLVAKIQTYNNKTSVCVFNGINNIDKALLKNGELHDWVRSGEDLTYNEIFNSEREAIGHLKTFYKCRVLPIPNSYSSNNETYIILKK